MINTCNLCGRPLERSDDPLSRDCGGDCWGCIGEIEAEGGDVESGYKVMAEISQGLRDSSGRALRQAGTVGAYSEPSESSSVRLDARQAALAAPYGGQDATVSVRIPSLGLFLSTRLDAMLIDLAVDPGLMVEDTITRLAADVGRAIREQKGNTDGRS